MVVFFNTVIPKVCDRLKERKSKAEVNWSRTSITVNAVRIPLRIKQMFRLGTFRLVQRTVILTTTLCLFGCIFVWFHLYAEFDGERPRERNRSARLLELVGSSPDSSRIERLDREINLRNLKRNLGNRDFSSSVVVRNVFGIRPNMPVSRRYQSNTGGGGKKDKGIIPIGIDSRELDNDKRYLFVFQHYEQLGKTTENFVQLCSVAAYGSRTVVEPFVRDSRMCGLQTGWWGDSLTKSRLFRPLSLYFDVRMMNELLSQNGYATVRPLDEFKQYCNKTKQNLTLVHFLYNDGIKETTTRKWFNLSEKQYRLIRSRTEMTGWTNCPVIDKGLNISQRLGGMRAGRQLCVDAERVQDHKVFEQKILNGDKCVVFVYWKGFGANRTHFKPKVKLRAREMVHRLPHSSLIVQEADLFRRVFLNKPYIGVHVRSERQILWYSTEAVLKCVNLVVKLVASLKQKHKIDTVFLATDLTQYGSDILRVPRKSASLDFFENQLSDGLKPKKYSPHEKDPMLRDHGVVAIVEMNILSNADYMVTLGSGSFQEWVMALFIGKKKDSKQDWAITRVCSREKKIH